MERSQAVSKGMLRITEASASAVKAATSERTKLVYGVHRHLTELNDIPQVMRVG